MNGSESQKRDTPVVSIAACETYEIHAIRQGLAAVLAPLGGIGRFVRPGMDVLLKPNLLTAAHPWQAVTTHPTVVQAVAELVGEAGGAVVIGDSPAGPLKNARVAWWKSGLTEVSARTGGQLTPFEDVSWNRLNGNDYFIARPVVEADLVINLPKLKTHMLTLYTGAVKNLFGIIPGTRKRELHFQAPGVRDFSSILVDVLKLVQPGLTIMDGVLGQEGNGPGMSGTPHWYGCLAASTDPVALDTVMTQALGYGQREVLHLAEAGARGLGVSDLNGVRIEGDREALDFGSVCLPKSHWYFHAPAWAAAPLRRITRLRPRMIDRACLNCGACAAACPMEAITPDLPPTFDLDQCIGCLCCAEVCPQGAIVPHRNLIARLIGMGY
jgi:uncharacterized protein (DUF362 family)/Pyruvate/2-oxoacid:ferredoxin oxidoreductase delta subunit